MFFTKGRLQTKLILILLFLGIIPVLICSFILFRVAASNVEQFMQEDLEHVISITQQQFEEKQAQALRLAERYGKNEDLIGLLRSNDREQLLRVVAPLYLTLQEEQDIAVFEFGDAQGNVILRAHNPGKFGDNKGDNASIQAALDGQPVKGFEVGSSGLAVRAVVPVMDNGTIIATLQTGFSDEFLAHVSQLIAGDLTIYQDGMPVMSSNSETNFESSGQQADPAIYEQVSAGSRVERQEGGFIHIYMPLMSPTGKEVVGMYHITQDISASEHMKASFLYISSVLILVSSLLAAALAIILARGLIRPIQSTIALMRQVAKGNLRVQAEIKDPRNELSQLSSETLQMADHLRHLVSDITEASSRSEATANEVNEITLHNRTLTSDINDSMQQVSAAAMNQAESVDEGMRGIQELASVLSASKSNTQLIYEHNTRVMKKQEDGAKAVEGLLQTMKQNVQITETVHHNITTLLGDIESIAAMTDLIRGIAEQTNLLALNAAIEAARAGEQGRGFAVVAGEVRKLAEESNVSASNIQSMIRSIQLSAQSTTDAMAEAMAIVQRQEEAVNSTSLSFQDIEATITSVHTLIDRLTQDMDVLDKKKDTIMNLIEDTSALSEQTAASSQQVLASIDTQVHLYDNVNSRMEQLNQIIKELQQTVRKFST
ncbi:methyl-accepting chemotaxis protein [Paenibacillus tarimensis]|uniref:methyl-accepting chemotaxis protein n=1 Tax=Paenibacillus tarimensis TaxID=416012 RepID=UPI001F3811C3|nr:methyl-accepting chemotaxis protein [Paenibacillus tarimensis]MCF2944396.1 methyl-accepting chemotaxis protein [Paenibacillus tarimensis]